jgi:pilus assembly protein CpaB
VTRRRRALLLAGLALLLGGLAASDVASRVWALREGLGPSVGVVVARSELAAGSTIGRASLSVREVPARYAPRGAVADPAALVGMRLSADVAAGQELLPALVGTPGGSPAAGPPVAKGERVAEVVAAAAAGQVVPGGRVDVLVTRDDRPGAPGRTVLALEDVAVVAVASAPAGETAGTARVAASLRVTLRQAVYLAAAQAFAQELRLLPRAPGDRARGRAGMSADASLEVG